MTEQDHSTALLPFEAFVAHLRRQGFRVGVEHHLRLRTLLNRIGPDCSPEELKTLLCPLFATNAEQQEFFYRAFDDFYPLLREGGDARLAADGALPEARISRTAVRRWPYFVLGLVVLVFAAITDPRSSTHSAAPTPRLAESKAPQAVTPATPAAAKPATILGNGQLLPFRVWYMPLLAWYIRNRAALGWTAVLGPLMFWLAAELYRFRKRRLLIRSARGKVPPYSWPVRTDFVAEIYEPQEIATVCRLLHRRSLGDSERLDVAATVAASIATLGFPTFRYRRDSRLPEYLFLIDRASYRDHQARFHEHLAETLRRQGLFVTSYFYEGDPRVCWNLAGDESFHLEELQRTHRDHRLLVFGDGEQFLDAMSGRLARWHGLFGAWADHALLTPEPVSTWGARELTLAGEFTVVPATLDGLALLAAYFELPSSTNLRVEDSAAPSGFSHEVAGLRRYLGDDCFQWLCACAIYPELQWDLTLSVGSLPSMPPGLVRGENIVRLLRLEWFRAGVMPDELRRELIAQLKPGVERGVREAIVGLLEKSPAPAGTFASSAQQFQIAYQRYRGNPADRKTRRALKSALENLSPDEVEQDYAYLDAAESVQRSPIEFVLPKRLSRLLYPAGGPRFGVRGLVRAGVAAVLMIGSLQALRVMDRRVQTALIKPPTRTEVNPKDGLAYVWIQPGTFTMGCSPGDTQCDSDEIPAHQVTMTRGFWMGQTDVTQEAYQRVTGKNPSEFKGPKLPVESVTWDDAQSYCRVVGMRLPTEAEWEYAARAGSRGSRYGDLDQIAWYGANSGGKTHEVMQKQPNAWGLYDMLGNVWQWTADWYADKYPGNAETDPQGPASGRNRVLRGGSWYNNPANLRASYRVRVVPEYHNDNLGFRCLGN